MRGGSLCTGGGGLDLGLTRSLGIEWVWHCEPDPHCAIVLDHHYPGVPNHGDLFAFDWTTAEPFDLVSAGFPCPDYSLAGRRAGIEGDHGQVWFGVAAALRAIHPRYVVLENVPGIRTAAGLRRDAGESALGVVLADLAALGYRWAYDCLRAADIGAPHGRDRWFCVARLPSADPDGAGVHTD